MDTEAMIRALEGTGNYRVLRRLKPKEVFHATEADGDLKIGLVVDLETTGLDTVSEEVIELGMVKFTYDVDGTIVRVLDSFACFNEPKKLIPAEVTELTGITNDMVSGHRIDSSAVTNFISDAVIVIAHNASFDRPIAERYWPQFQDMAWACSANQIKWRREGFEGSRLPYLLMKSGMFHDAHRAVDDCRALLEVLSMPLPKSGNSAFASLLKKARRKTIRLWAEHSPFDMKDQLKARGYRWNDGSDGRPRAWYVDVDEGAYDAEMNFLHDEIYCRKVELRTQEMTAYSRFSNRGL